MNSRRFMRGRRLTRGPLARPGSIDYRGETEGQKEESMRALGFLAVLVALLGAQAATAACPGPEEIRRFVEDWKAKRPTKALPVTDMKDAVCARDKLVDALGGSLGRVIGYKAGLTAKATQERFNASAPVAGVLLESMMLKDGATVPAAFGGRSVWEGDMLLVVKDEGINQAKTPEEALRHISAMRPFIELPDLALAPSEKLDGTQLTAINVAARLGVAGPEVPLQPAPETMRLLADTKIVATDASGATLAEGRGAATLGNPLNVVVWLVEDLAQTGRKLSAGDLISIGSFTPLMPPKPGQVVTVRYEGFPGTPKVSVTFE
jgi:2-keto-4-pentenoate hydratase